MALIHEKMIAIMNEVSAIGKNEKNAQQGFKFRGIDTVYNELHAVMAKHGVFTTSTIISSKSEDRVTKSGSNLIYRVLEIMYTFYAADGSCVTSTVIGEGMDSGDKASNKAMAVAHKYLLLQAYMIPTEEEKDPDMESHEPSISVIDRDIQAEIKRLGACPAEMAGWEKFPMDRKISALNWIKKQGK